MLRAIEREGNLRSKDCSQGGEEGGWLWVSFLFRRPRCLVVFTHRSYRCRQRHKTWCIANDSKNSKKKKKRKSKKHNFCTSYWSKTRVFPTSWSRVGVVMRSYMVLVCGIRGRAGGLARSLRVVRKESFRRTLSASIKHGPGEWWRIEVILFKRACTEREY